MCTGGNMLDQQNQTNLSSNVYYDEKQCDITFLIRQGMTPSVESRCTKIIDTSAIDSIEHLFLCKRITKEQWQLVNSLRKIALQARRSKGIRTHLQSHSQYWGMPHICSQDDYVNKRAERRFNLFMLFIKPFIEHQLFDKYMLHLIVYGGAMLKGGDVIQQPSVSAVYSVKQIEYALQIIEYVYNKAYRIKNAISV